MDLFVDLRELDEFKKGLAARGERLVKLTWPGRSRCLVAVVASDNKGTRKETKSNLSEENYENKNRVGR